MVTRTKKSVVVSIAAAAISATLSLTLLTSPAQAADTGLYGATPPTFDGVDRQSKAILGLGAVGVTPARSAVQWLLDQQCADGSFEPYRADTSSPCAPGDPENFTGPNTNSTAWAAMALKFVGEDRAAMRAARALIAETQRSGRTAAWPAIIGGQPDASSTGLVINALEYLDIDTPVAAAGERWLRQRVIQCGRKYGGAMTNDPSSPAANNFASTQGLLGLTKALPVEGPTTLQADPPCSGSAVTRVSSYLARTLNQDGLLTYLGYGDDVDYGSTAVAVVALGEAGLGRQGVQKAVAALKRDAREWITTDAGDSVGAAGWLLMVAESTGEDPRSFGGVDLVRTITGSLR